MAKNDLDPLFRSAERLASDFSLFPRTGDLRLQREIAGLLAPSALRRELEELRSLSVDEYIRRTVSPTESPSRPGARSVLNALGWDVLNEFKAGPLFAAEVEVPFGAEGQRRVGVLAQERDSKNGVWMPEHHLRAVEIIREFARRHLPIVTLIDTPGADAGEQANLHNQAHTISRLIAEMAQIHVPTVGVVLGMGYSGGAIPLATSNVLLSVRDGVFNTIQPRGLANIARKYDLSWQECAKYVGVSPVELHEQGYLDGVIDFVPGEGPAQLRNFERAVVSSITAIEQLARHFVQTQDGVLEHYRRGVVRFLEPSSELENLERTTQLSTITDPTSYPNVFGVAYRYLRYLGLRRRISSTTVDRYGRLSVDEIPRGDRSERTERERRSAFEKWLEAPLEIKYDDTLSKVWRRYADALSARDAGRGRVATFLLGTREQSYRRALDELAFEFSFHLYNSWKDSSQYNLPAFIELLSNAGDEAWFVPDNPTILDVATFTPVRESLIEACENIAVFDLLYDNVIHDQKRVAREARDHNVISRESVEELLGSALNTAVADLARRTTRGDAARAEAEERLLDQSRVWLRRLATEARRGAILRSVAEWKKIAYPRVSEPLFAIITFLIGQLLPNYYRSEDDGRRYDGRITPRDIGVKDFWNRLAEAYQDLLAQEVLSDVKRNLQISPQRILDQFFTEVRELDSGLMTADPVRFPGFRISIEQALSNEITPCGILTASARFEHAGVERRVGVAVSNLAFQAGSFDMASAEKFCRLLRRCAVRKWPVIGFVSSGGMQTKEGAGSLFSMSIVNDRITRFVRDTDLPVIFFGFGDCTGGAQASFVTHPLAHTFYFSGTNMPFAGQIVVPSHLPLRATLSNYLSEVPGAMDALVTHPFAEELDARLTEIDPSIPVGSSTVEVIISQVLSGRQRDEVEERSDETPSTTLSLYRPVKRTLIHARGCTAVKLTRVARERGIEVVLVQADPDMDSVAAGMLGSEDLLVCLGGSTPDESYLNAHSVVHIAEREGADSLHPGIGFLSENADFAQLCRAHGLNFVGPSVHSMERIGNKSNAIKTAQGAGVPVVPGSHGILTDPEAAARSAEAIGYPVVIKAVHGGGGKGIRVVEHPEDLVEAFSEISIEARSAFGNSDCYIEKFVTSLRHVELQVLRDSHGHTRVLGLRDCSVQRNNQKIIEESDSELLTEELRESLYRYAESLAEAVDYVGAGTVEFIFDLEASAIYFMEMNARLQVEHPVTEWTSGVDIVGAQFDIAAGKSIESLEIGSEGYAMEVRVNAERAQRGAGGGLELIPDPGTVTECELPEQEGFEIISAVKAGSVISPYYDSMIAQIICHGKDRADVIRKLVEYLSNVRIEGVCTNIPLLLRILEDEVFQKGRYDTRYLPGLLGRLDLGQLIEEISVAAGRSSAEVDLEVISIEGSDELKVVAPSPGIFYTAPSPEEPMFADVGEVVDSDHTLCLIEAMKLFRSVSLSDFNQEDAELYPSDCRYEIVKVVPANAQAVNRGDLLFVVRPLRAA